MHEGDAKLAAVLEAWLEEEAGAGRVVLTATAAQTARMIVAALSGHYKTAGSYAEYLSGLDVLGGLFGRALAA